MMVGTLLVAKDFTARFVENKERLKPETNFTD
jgi:hypothetical protein